MAKYKYRIVKDGNWRFELLPNNSNLQYVGRSEGYQTKEEMLGGLNRFKNFLRKNQTDILYNKETVKKDNNTFYYAYLVFSDNNEKFYTREYWHKYEPDNSIERIINNFDSNVRNDLSVIKKERWSWKNYYQSFWQFVWC